MNYESYTKCSCGAVTVHTDEGDFSCCWQNRKKLFPWLDFRKIPRMVDTYNCDHCCNHFGLDLCGCGSGNPFGHCDNGLPECGIPMQELGAYDRVMAKDALSARGWM